MRRLVMKFGGSSVASVDHMKRVAEVIAKKRKTYDEVVVVVSAMGDTTDNLEELANTASPTPSGREMDALMSVGEQVSASLLAIVLEEAGMPAVSLTGAQVGISAEGWYRKGRIQNVDTKRIEEAFEANQIVVVTGFQGISAAGDVMTLGRGGSDTSAVALAVVLDAECIIYTDVDGIYTVDPRRYPKAHALRHLSYDEALEMAYLGTKVIEPRSVELAQQFDVKLRITLNTGKEQGTVISNEGMAQPKKLSNVSVLDDVLLVRVIEEKAPVETMTTMFSKLAEQEVNIDIISKATLEDGRRMTSFTSNVAEKQTIATMLEELSLEFEFIEDLSKVSLVGAAMRTQPGVAAELFKLCAEHHIDFLEVTTSEITLSLVVHNERAQELVTLLADHFEL